MDGLAPDERISLSLPAVVVRSTVESSGEILAGDKKFYFYSDCTRSTQVCLSLLTNNSIAVPHSIQCNC